jgi:ABC-type transport system involved in cytochrome c biogenesis permease subunit
MQPILEKRRTNPESLKFQDQKFMELYQKINLFQLTSLSYSTNRLPAPPNSDDEADRRRFGQELIAEMRAVQQLEDGKPASIIPPLNAAPARSEKPSDDPSTKWRALRPALFASYAAKAMGMNDGDNKVMLQFLDLRDAVRDGKPLTVNQEVEKYAKLLGEQPNLREIQYDAAFEGWYNKFSPISGCIAFYLMAFCLTLFSMFIFPQPLRRTAFWMTVVVFAVHVVAIAARVYITGRAPVINLYSSAVFIGYGAVLFGLVLEMLYPIRVGLLAGTAIGSTSLLVAYGLDSSDTMHVLQAVLDTQFWLTTHVQCITAGYLATFFAGFIAIGAIIHRAVHAKTLLSDSPNPEAAEMQRVLMRMTYGTICFATFFSLIGTVLGGLWADDSWGRFWGWDPKENGALMIVIWNAILLHARWDKLVRERGFALLAIGGNIITAWSWFGTNQLGIGLHSYGFTSGVLMILTWFVFSQLLIIVVCGILTAPWLYGRNSKPGEFDSLGRPTGSWE